MVGMSSASDILTSETTSLETHSDTPSSLNNKGYLCKSDSHIKTSCHAAPDSSSGTTGTVKSQSSLPDYVQTLKIKDSNGQIKELIFPKGLDLDRPKRARTTFSTEQLSSLEREFHRNQYLVGRERSALATRLGLSETQVKVWYQNRRTKYKRDREREQEGLSPLNLSYLSSSQSSSQCTPMFYPFPHAGNTSSQESLPGSSLVNKELITLRRISAELCPTVSAMRNKDYLQHIFPHQPSILPGEVCYTKDSHSVSAVKGVSSNTEMESSKSNETEDSRAEETKSQNSNSPESAKESTEHISKYHPTVAVHSDSNEANVPGHFSKCNSLDIDKLIKTDQGSRHKIRTNGFNNQGPTPDTPLSTFFGTFKSVSPTISTLSTHSAFRPFLAADRQLHPLYYLKPTGSQGWIP